MGEKAEEEGTELSGMSDLQRAFDALKNKQGIYTTYWNYYDGEQPLVYSAARLREVFRGLDANFVENWCEVVINAVLERVQLKKFTVANNETATERLNTIWAMTEMNLDADDAHLGALVCGESFVIVWPDEIGGEADAYYNDPRMCHVFYSAANPRKKEFAAKWWDDGELWRLNLYYSDRIEYYAARSKSTPTPNSYKVFESWGDGIAENPYGVIPVFHLRPERRVTVSELKNVVPLQAALNKLLADMMVSAEFGAFRQRWVISNADTGVLKNAPNEVWDLPAADGQGQDTQVGEFSGTNLGNFLTAIDHMATSIGVITRTPRHYFFQQGGAPSGEALITMEAPLNHKCKRYIRRFTATWQKVGAFLLSLEGMEVHPVDIGTEWEKVQTILPRTQAEIRQMGVSAGLPLRTLLRREGWSASEIAEMEADKRAEMEQAQGNLAQALIAQQRMFDQGGPQG